MSEYKLIQIEEEIVKVLISIRPEWVKKILSGEKTIEVRKSKPKFAPPITCYIYECGTGKVVAEFICDEFKVIPFDRNHNSSLTRIQTEGSCLTAVQVMDYLKKGSMYGVTGFGWHISDLKIYDVPIELKEFGISRPPQSWQYVKHSIEQEKCND